MVGNTKCWKTEDKKALNSSKNLLENQGFTMNLFLDDKDCLAMCLPNKSDKYSFTSILKPVKWCDEFFLTQEINDVVWEWHGIRKKNFFLNKKCPNFFVDPDAFIKSWFYSLLNTLIVALSCQSLLGRTIKPQVLLELQTVIL